MARYETVECDICEKPIDSPTPHWEREIKVDATVGNHQSTVTVYIRIIPPGGNGGAAEDVCDQCYRQSVEAVISYFWDATPEELERRAAQRLADLRERASQIVAQQNAERNAE